MVTNKRWILFTFLTAFSIYWTVNLILWFPWSVNTVLGMTLMLTVAPFIWAYGVYQCLNKFQGVKQYQGAIFTSLIYILVAAIADYIFFGKIRNAMKELYHPTTLSGYLFLILLPFILTFLFSKKIKNKQNIQRQDFIKYGVLGFFSIVTIFIIIKFNMTI